MSNSFIDIGEKGFWARDGFVEAMQLCLINEIESQKLDSIDWIDEYKYELAIQSVPLFYGGMSMKLEEFLLNDERKAKITKLIDQIIEKIDSEEEYITGSILHEMRKRAITILSETGKMKFKYQEEFESVVNDSRWNESAGISQVKDRYQHSFRLLKKLINGEMNTTASSPEDYWNF